MDLKKNAIFKLEMTSASKKKSTVVLIIVFVLYVFFATLISALTESYLFGSESQNVLFFTVAFSQLAVNLAICPLFTAVKISQERERQTFDMLIATGMTAFEIVMGKYISSVLRILLFSAAVLPIYAYMMLLGGISPLAILVLYLMVIFEVLVICAVSMMFSALSKRSVGAVFLTFGVLAGYEFLNIIFILLQALIVTILEANGHTVPQFFATPFAIYFNPVLGAIYLLAAPFFGLDYSLIFNFSTGARVATIVISFGIWLIFAILSLMIAVKKVDPFPKRKGGKSKGE